MGVLALPTSGTVYLEMSPITQTVLEKAANLRATLDLKTPDAIHAATALLNKCVLFVTNDSAFRRLSDLTVTVLSEIALLDETNKEFMAE